MITVDRTFRKPVKAEIRDLKYFVTTKEIPINSQMLCRRFASDRGAQGAETSSRF